LQMRMLFSAPARERLFLEFFSRLLKLLADRDTLESGWWNRKAFGTSLPCGF
jgi:hypothetical protein